MSEFVDKLIAVERELSAEKGGFSFFGLLERVRIDAKAAKQYDLVVAAPWLDADSDVQLHSLISVVTHALTSDEWRNISAVVILPVDHPGIVNMNTMLSAEHSHIDQSDNIVNGFKMKSGLVITSKRR